MSSASEGRANPRRDLVEAQILEHATRLFAERGFAATSLRDIADATGLTRPALYHYVRNKDDLLERLVRDRTEGPATQLRKINVDTDRTATERLREMAYAVALSQARAPERFRLLIMSEAELPEALAEVYSRGRRQVLREFTSTIDQGISAGEFRRIDARVAALGIIGMCNWVAWWHRPGENDEAVASQLAEMAVASVAEPNAAEGAGGGPARALRRVRQDLDYLERVMDAAAPID